jgi:uncharacterized membrane protein HdeD (DUF308 family)
MSINPSVETGTMTALEAEKLSRSWWVLLVNGILSVIAGVLVLSIPWTFQSLAFFIGAVLIVRGLLQAFSPPRAGSTRSWNIGVGIVSFLVGLAIIAFPAFAGFTFLTLALFIGIWLIVSGIAETVGSISNRASVSYWWLGTIGGILSVILGFFALFRPLLTLAVLVLVVGIWAVVIGIMEIVLSFEVKSLPNTLKPGATPEAGPRKIA